jgi:hypothetical protein
LLQAIGPDEKALIAVGDNWEWTPNKRLLVNVTEASFYHMKRQAVLAKLGAAQLAMMPLLKCLRFVYNDFTTLKSVSYLHPYSSVAGSHFVSSRCRAGGVYPTAVREANRAAHSEQLPAVCRVLARDAARVLRGRDAEAAFLQR